MNIDKENAEIDMAWECLEYGKFIQKAEEILLFKGPGMVIFKFFTKEKSKKNCEMYHTAKGDYFWEEIQKSSPEIFQKYDSTLHIFVCVQIPCVDDTTVGSSRLYGNKQGIYELVMESRSY